MKKLVFYVALATLTLIPSVLPATAASCYDLWYERNQIYRENGYCFTTKLARETFGNAGCFTSNPKLSKFEARDVKEIRLEEKRRGCKVN